VIVPDSGIAIILRRHTTTIPVVVLQMGDRLVERLARPGGNVTGFHMSTVDIIGKVLQLLKEIPGKPARVAALSYVWTPDASLQSYRENLLDQFQGLAQGLGLEG
jgi:ABC-type uncharacterized transport system substrate-binding protein